MTTVKCPRCGKDVPQRNFCGFCGSLLTVPPESADNGQTPQETETPPESAGASQSDILSNDILSQLDEVTTANRNKREPSDIPRKNIPQDLLQQVTQNRAAAAQPKKAGHSEDSGVWKAPAAPAAPKTGSPEPPVPVAAQPSPEPPRPARKIPWMLIGISLIVVIVVLAAAAGGYVIYQKGRVISFLEREISIPSASVLADMRDRLPEKGCAVDVLQMGIKPVTDEALEAYRSRSGLSGATGTHMIWLKATCSSIGGIPVSVSIRAEKPDALPAPYRGKHMVYDPNTDRMMDYIPVGE